MIVMILWILEGIKYVISKILKDISEIPSLKYDILISPLS